MSTRSIFIKIKNWLLKFARSIFGTGDDDALYWALMFQRKILNRDIGVPVNFFKQEAKNLQLLSELENALASLESINDEGKVPVHFCFVPDTNGNGTDSQDSESDFDENEFTSSDYLRSTKLSNKPRDTLRSCESFGDSNSLFDKPTNFASHDHLYAFDSQDNLLTEHDLAALEKYDFVVRDSKSDRCSLESTHQKQMPLPSSRPEDSTHLVDIFPQSLQHSEVKSKTGEYDEVAEDWIFPLGKGVSLSQMRGGVESRPENDDVTPANDSLSSETVNVFMKAISFDKVDVGSEVIPPVFIDEVDSVPLKSSDSNTSHWSLAPSIEGLNINLHNNLEVSQSADSQHSSSVDEIVPISEVRVATKCPIEDCRVPHCYLSEVQHKTESDSPIKRFLKRTKNRILALPFLDVALFGRPKSVKRAQCIGTSATQMRTIQTEYDVEHKSVDLAGDPKDFEEFLESIRFKLPPIRKYMRQNPFQKFLKYVGLKSQPFPKNPHEIGTMVSFKAEVRKLARNLCDWIKTSIGRKCLSDSPQPRTLTRALLWALTSRTKDESLYLTGNVAFKFYKMLVSVEIACNTHDLLEERKMALQHYKWKYDTLQHIIKLARDYYYHPINSKRHEWKNLKTFLSDDHESDTDLRFNLSYIPAYRPLFTVFVMLGQILFLVSILSIRGFAAIRFVPETRTIENTLTLSGPQTYTHQEEYNPWLGPSRRNLIYAGVAFGPCLRTSSTKRKQQLSFYVAPNHTAYGCCHVHLPVLVYGTTTHMECFRMTAGKGRWDSHYPSCDKYNFTFSNSGLVAIKPCCVGLDGRCLMVSRTLCHFLDGIFHDNCDHCSQVNCFQDICRLAFLDNPLKALPAAPWILEERGWKQMHRIVFSLLSSEGLLILVPVLILEAVLMRLLETYIGWHRVAIIYIIGTTAGILAQLAFQGGQPAGGVYSGAIAVFGVVILEFSQAWKLLPHPCLEAFKLFIMLFFFLFMGTFTIISLTAILISLITGVVTGLMVVPYITFNVYLGAWRGRLVVLSFLLLGHILCTLCIFSFFIYTESFCDVCDELECIQYSKGSCPKLNY